VGIEDLHRLDTGQRVQASLDERGAVHTMHAADMDVLFVACGFVEALLGHRDLLCIALF
jgi:hypothetical protein